VKNKYKRLPPNIWEDEFARWWAVIVIAAVAVSVFLWAFPDVWLEAGP